MIDLVAVNLYTDDSYATEETTANVQAAIDALTADEYEFAGVNDRHVFLQRKTDAAEPA